MVYLDISGVRLDQTTLFAIVEGVCAHSLWLALLCIVNCRCLRPLAPHPSWVNAWRVHTTVYGILAIATEVMWVQLGLIMGPEGIRKNAIGCEWSEGHLMAWTMFQVVSWASVALVCTYCRRLPVGHMITSYIGVHAMALMSFSMMGMNEQGACASDVFPLLTAMIGMGFMCCCFPWHMGAWSVPIPHHHHPRTRDVDLEVAAGVESPDERDVLTCWGWRMLERYLRRNPRPYHGGAGSEGEGQLLNVDDYEQNRIVEALFGKMNGRERAQSSQPAMAEEVGIAGEARDSDSDSNSKSNSNSTTSGDSDDDDDDKENGGGGGGKRKRRTGGRGAKGVDDDEVVMVEGDHDALPLEDLPSISDSMRLEPFVANPKQWRSSSKEKDQL